MANFVAQIREATPQQMLALAVGVNAALRGETLNTTAIVAESGSSSVTVQDSRCRAGRLACLIPLNAVAAGAQWWLASMAKGEMTFSFQQTLPDDAHFGVAFMGSGNN